MGAFSERICAQILQVPSTSQRVFCRTFVAVPAPLHLKEIVELGLAPRGQTSERRCQQIVEVSAPQVAEPFCVGMFEHAEKEEWLDGSALAFELHNAFCAVVLSVGNFS